MQHFGGGKVGKRLIHLKIAMRRRAPRVNDSLRDALMIEVLKFFAQHIVFQQRWATPACPQRVLVGADRLSQIGSQRHFICSCGGGKVLRFVRCIAGKQFPGRRQFWMRFRRVRGVFRQRQSRHSRKRNTGCNEVSSSGFHVL